LNKTLHKHRMLVNAADKIRKQFE